MMEMKGSHHQMKTKEKEKEKEEVLFFENETPHFFKIFLKDDDLLTTTLEIPRKFARKHGSCISDPVSLTVPRGDRWEVRLEKKDGAIFLRDGWAEFVMHYRISHGCFVVFRFEGRSCFQVIIFNMTACEIDYPVKPNKPTLTPKSEDVECGIDQEVWPFEFLGKKREKERMPEHLPRHSKIVRRGPRAINAGEASHSLTKREPPIEKATPSGAKRKRGTFDGHLNFNSLKFNTAAAKAAGTSGSLARACSYQCERPSFVAIIGRCSFHPRHYMYFPTKFLKLGILRKGESGTVTLSVPDQKTWTVRYRNGRRCTISHGWKEFVSENDLRTGDVLVFELIRITKVAFRVVIFRNNVASQPCPCPEQRKRVTIKSACLSRRPAVPKVAKENPSFEAVISRRDAITGSHYVPIHFAKVLTQASHVMNDIATLKVGQMTWPVELRTHAAGSNALRMARGWIQFVGANDLQIGDVCTFKLVNKEHTVLEVSIRKKPRHP
ncbi:hypothetical protein MLD38_028128 [Melastoma candidum]|uniref:Uncharacterized protein n=1 Tax=Melastoma candidum TaxID=119954 RepID=A0ACB9N065_9MYRT|nr:hypothetical protein MLD38_028128 [Melastoma candidum]